MFEPAERPYLYLALAACVVEMYLIGFRVFLGKAIPRKCAGLCKKVRRRQKACLIAVNMLFLGFAFLLVLTKLRGHNLGVEMAGMWLVAGFFWVVLYALWHGMAIAFLPMLVISLIHGRNRGSFCLRWLAAATQKQIVVSVAVTILILLYTLWASFVVFHRFS